MSRDPVVAVTAGDPCGIGPEVILKALRAARAGSRVRFVVIGDLAVFERLARRLHLPLPAWQVRVSTDRRPWTSRLTFLDCRHRGRFLPGHSSAAAGQASLDYLQSAVELWRSGRIRALVTGPVTKWAAAKRLPSFIGQTEYLAGATRARDVVMMFVSDHLRIALLTRHLPLSRVSSVMTPRLLRRTVEVTAQTLTAWFNIRRPRLAVCGLNPHAGESSASSEEQTVMRPALEALRRRGIRCEGPFAADGFFASPPSYDAVICPYHDQGLIPFKMLARDRGCQLSAGLPLLRTSPDHGTALDIAGRGIANPGSMRYALELAIRLAHRQIVRAGPVAAHPGRPRRAALSASSAPGARGPRAAPPARASIHMPC